LSAKKSGGIIQEQALIADFMLVERVLCGELSIVFLGCMRLN